MNTKDNQAKGIKLIKFEQSNCAPCAAMDMFFKAQEFDSYERVNPFDDPHLAVKYDIGSVPTLILVDENGNEIARSVGFNPPEIEKLISQL